VAAVTVLLIHKQVTELLIQALAAAVLRTAMLILIQVLAVQE
jgi:hypothetical protein